ncbi:hypothetical protein GCM10010254_24150 [Streptomyces chromofuscus]|nr:hypothetical protein GCM10010254_24150 [Streptomyces chromofuscus]
MHAVLNRGADGYVQALTQAAARLVTLDGLRTDVPPAEVLDVLFFCLGPHAG